MEERTSRRLRRAVRIIAVVDLLALAVIGWYFWQARPERSQQALPMAAQEELGAVGLGQALRHISLVSEPAITDGRIAIRLSNAADSPYAVAVELINLQTGQTIATTGRIDPGYCLETITPQQPLEPGATLGLARLHVYHVQSGAYLGTAAKQVLLNVEEEEPA